MIGLTDGTLDPSLTQGTSYVKSHNIKMLSIVTTDRSDNGTGMFGRGIVGKEKGIHLYVDIEGESAAG